MKAPFRILIVAGLCVVALIGLVVREGMARASGTEILLTTDVVDPRSLLSGHYVTIGLVEQLEDGAICPAAFDETTEPQWVAFEQVEDHHRAVGVAASRTEAEALSPLVARGSASCDAALVARGDESATRPGFIRTSIGVSRFYADQEQAEAISSILRAQSRDDERRVLAIVSLGEDGRARLKGLVVDGERLELDWL